MLEAVILVVCTVVAMASMTMFGMYFFLQCFRKRNSRNIPKYGEFGDISETLLYRHQTPPIIKISSTASISTINGKAVVSGTYFTPQNSYKPKRSCNILGGRSSVISLKKFSVGSNNSGRSSNGGMVSVNDIQLDGSTKNEISVYEDDELDDHSLQHYELGYDEKTSSSCSRGTLTFGLRYDFIHRVLMLHVICARQLPSEGSLSVDHPYIKMYLLPERRNHCRTRISKKIKLGPNPNFNEMFSFDVSYDNIPHRMLQFTLYNFDRFARHDLVGNVIMRDLLDKSDLSDWTEYTMPIVSSQGKNDFGVLLLHLSYSLNKEKLSVTVSKAYNLRPMDITGASDPYVKIEQVYQRKRVKLKKTSIKRANLNPVYHECLEFDLPFGDIDDTMLLVQVMDWDRIGSDDLLGCCIIGKDSPTVEGQQQWNDCFQFVSSNNNTEKLRPVGTWHYLLADVPTEFRKLPKAKK